MSELRVPPAVLDTVRADLDAGRQALEDAAGSAPSGVDAGELTALLLGMLGKVSGNAAAVSEGLAAASAQVADAGADFWEVDAAQAQRHGGGGAW